MPTLTIPHHSNLSPHKRVCIARAFLGLSQQAFSSYIGVKESRVNGYEKQRYKIPLEKVTVCNDILEKELAKKLLYPFARKIDILGAVFGMSDAQMASYFELSLNQLHARKMGKKVDAAFHKQINTLFSAFLRKERGKR